MSNTMQKLGNLCLSCTLVSFGIISVVTAATMIWTLVI